MRAADCPMGGIVHFGKYKQFTGARPTPIEWRVLSNNGHYAAMVSVYALDCVQYHDKFESVNWETCSLRRWMNLYFLNTAFTLEEQARLEAADSGDKVCLMSAEEAKIYFYSDQDRICKGTEYAEERGACISVTDACLWLLRSSYENSSYASYVSFGGNIVEDGNAVDFAHMAIRPMILLFLES